MGRPVYETIDEYIDATDGPARSALEGMRAAIAAAVPEATETISYAIPTFDLDGRHLIHFAAFTSHASVYPVTPAVVERFPDEVAKHRVSKGTLRFDLGEPVPFDLVGRMAAVMAEERRSERR